MENNNYNVILSENLDASEAAIGKLAELFKISTVKASKMIQQEAFVIKKQTDKKTAEKFHKAITATGINCHLENIAEDDSPLPTIQEITPPASTKPLIDPARPDISPLHSERLDLSLDAAPVEKTSASNKKEKEFENIDSANFCPDCGTIRASATSACVHCGYDPAVIKRRHTRAMLIKVGVIFVALSLAALISWPFYQQFAKQNKIEADLKLAFDTRNTVTEFINRTNFWPNQNIDADLPKNISNASLKSVVVSDNAVITVTIKGEALDGDEQTLIFTPNILKGRIVWNCLKGTLKNEFRPDICLAKPTDE